MSVAGAGFRVDSLTGCLLTADGHITGGTLLLHCIAFCVCVAFLRVASRVGSFAGVLRVRVRIVGTEIRTTKSVALWGLRSSSSHECIIRYLQCTSTVVGLDRQETGDRRQEMKCSTTS